MGISAVGSLQSVAATGVTRRSITTHAVGNLVLLSVQAKNGAQVSAVNSNRAAGGWLRLAGPFNPPGNRDNLEIWGAAVSSVGSDTIVVTFGSDVSSAYVELDAQEFTAGLGSATTWQLDTWGGLTTTSSSSVLTFPQLTPQISGELYFGHGLGTGDAYPPDSPTPGFTYITNAAYDMTLFNTSVSGPVQPLAKLTFPSTSFAIGVLVAVVTSTTTDTGAGGSKTVTTLAAATLQGSGSLSGSAVLTSAAPPSISLQGSGSMLGYPGAGTPPAPATAAAPPPPPFAPNPPTKAGLTLYNELWPINAGDDTRGYPLRTFVDAAAGSMLQPLDDLCRDSAAGDPGWSQVLDPTRAPTSVLPWLGQFVGVTVDPALADADQRAQVTGEFGFSRGTLASIQAAANKYLLPGQSATIIERDGDPYTITVRAFGHQMLQRTYADVAVSYPTYTGFASNFGTYISLSVSITQVRAAVLAAKPAGLIANVVLASTATLVGGGALTGALASWSSAAFAGAGRLVASLASWSSATLAGAGQFAGVLTKYGPTAMLGAGSLQGSMLYSSVVQSAILAGGGAISGSPDNSMYETATLAGSGSLGGTAAVHSLPTVAGFYAPFTNNQDLSTITTTSFSPAAGEVIVVFGTSADQPCTVTGVSGGGLTWTPRVNLGASYNDPVRMWTAVVPNTPPASLSVSVTFGGSGASHGIGVIRWANAQLAASPAIGSSQSNTSASQTITTTGGASVICWIDSDWNVMTGTPTYRGDGVVSLGTQYVAGYTGYFAYQPASTPGTYTFGVSAPTGQKSTMVGIEIQSLTG